jgi:hypothetical protein
MSKDDKTTSPLVNIKTPEKEGKANIQPSGLVDIGDEVGKALDVIARFAFNFPRDKIWSWSRWKPWEIDLIASELTRLCAIDPSLRPKNTDGTPMRLAYIYLEFKGYLRLGEKGALRGEAKDMFQQKAEKEAMGDGWPSSMR